MIHPVVLKPEALTPVGWSNYHRIARAAYQAALGQSRSEEEIDYFVRWNSPEDFQAVRIDPNTTVGDRLFSNQEFSNTWLAVAADGANPIGFGYMANNISGNYVGRRIKSLGDSKKYAWIGEIVVAPEASGQGVAREIGKKLLQKAKPRQPVSTFIWPEEIQGIDDTLSILGFKAVGERKIEVFGPGTRPVTQVMMRADSVNKVREAVDI